MSMMTEDRTSTQNGSGDLEQRVSELEKAQAVQAATQAGVEATQAAAMSGAQATQAAAHAGTWSTMAAGSISLVVGIFLGVTIARS
ncbi:MAG: hypothetical protein ACJ73L_09325 [Actinomycetes bacterium]